MILIDWLFELPLWLLAFVLTFLLMGLSLVGLWVMRRWVQPRLKLNYEDDYYAAPMVQSAMLLYSLIAALTAVGVWQRYSQVSDIVSGEATVITSLWRELGGYPPPLRDVSRDILRGYTEQIINEAWPLQRRGQIPSAGVEWMDRLQEQIFTFEPKQESQKILQAEILRSFNQLVQQRRQRLDFGSRRSAGSSVDRAVSGAIGCIVVCLFFYVRSTPFQVFLLLALAGYLGMVLFLIVALDRPFAGDTGITPDSC
jgi:hypothetical protein